MRGVPPRVRDVLRQQAHWRESDGLAVVLAGAAAGYGGDRSRSRTRGRARSPAVGLRPKDAAKARPATARLPG